MFSAQANLTGVVLQAGQFMPFLGFPLGPSPARGRGLTVGEILLVPTI